jgi:hypothetical protein
MKSGRSLLAEPGFSRELLPTSPSAPARPLTNPARSTKPDKSEEVSNPGWLRRRPLLTGLLLMFIAWGLYLPSVRYGFAYYDDVRLLVNHPELYGQAQFSDNLKQIFLKSFPREEPLVLRDVTWALDSRMFGFGNPFGYHFGNVLLHGIVVALLFAFLLGTTRRYGLSLGISSAFLLLAIHTETVAWVMGRKDILATLFMLLALCAQSRRLSAADARAQVLWYGVSLGCVLAALLSKYNALTLFLVLYLHAVLFPYLTGERRPDAPFPRGRALLHETLLTIPSALLSVVIYLWYSRLLAAAGGQTVRGLRHLWDLINLDPLCFWVYVQQTFVPWHLRVFYTWPGLRQAYPFWQIAFSLATIAGLVALGMWMFRRRKDLFFYYGAFFVLLIPYLSLLNVGFWVAERYLYFAACCLLIIAASAVIVGLRHRDRIVRIGTKFITLVFVTANLFQHFSYQSAWKNGETLWQYHICLPDPSPTAYENLAGYYFACATAQQGTPESFRLVHKMDVVVEAGLAEFWRNRQQSPPPQTFLLFFQKSIVQEINSNLSAALASLLTSNQLNPGFDATYLNLARVYCKLAHTAQDSLQRKTYSVAARDHLGDYIQRAFTNLPVPAELRQEFEDMKAECLSFPRPFSMDSAPNAR